MKPSRFAVVAVLLSGVIAAGCGGRSKLNNDGGLDGGRAGDGGTDVRPGDGAGGNTGGVGGNTGGRGGNTGGVGGVGGMGGAMLTGLGINPPLVRVGLGANVTFTAIGRFSDGSTRDVSAQAAWSSSVPSVAVIMGGQAVTRSPGATVITANFGGASATASLTVSGAMLASLTVDPADSAVPVGMRTQLRATAVYSDGSKIDVTGQSVWQSGDNAIAQVSGGVVTGVRAGVTGIAATYQGMGAKATVRVTGASITLLEISPANPVLPLNASLQFSATAIYSDGTKSDATGLVTWDSTDRNVLVISTGGFASALTPGTTTVSAVIGNVATKTLVTVSRAQLLALRVLPNVASTPVGTTQAFRVVGGFSDGSLTDLTSSVAWSSGNERVATVSNAPGSQGVATGLSPGGASIAATLMGVSGMARLTITEATVTSLSLSPPTVVIGVRAIQQVRATATFSDGSQKDVTESTSWSIQNTGVASVSNAVGSAGQVIGLSAGATVLTANYGGVTAVSRVAVTAATLRSIAINPEMLTLETGTRQAVSATGTYSDGSTLDVTSQVTWSTDNPMVAGVSNAAGASGMVVGISAGQTTLIAMLGNVGSKALVTVTSNDVMSLSIAPVVPTLRVGQAQLFTATVVRQNGATQNVTLMASWSSSNPMVAPLGPGPIASRAICQAVGTSTISVTYMGLTDTTVLTCTPMRTLTDFQVTPFATSIIVGQATPFQATAIFSDGTTQNVTGQTTWTSSAPMVADVRNMGGMGGRGTVTGLSAGSATITGTYMGMTASGEVTVTDAKLSSVTVAPASLSLRVGDNQGLVVTAVYGDGSTRNVTGMSTFSSSDQMVADVSNGGLGGRGQVTALSVGTTTITASFMGFAPTVPVTVSDPKISSLQVTPVNPRLPKGSSVQFQAVAVYDDGSTRMVTGQASWSSSMAAVAGISNAGGSRGQATALSPGSTEISASFGGLSSATTLTVTAATISEIQVTPTNPTIPLNTTIGFQAVAVFSDFTTQNVTGLAGWESGDPDIAPVSNTGGRGQATGIAAGTTDIRATYMGLTGSTTLTVSSATVKEIQISPVNPRSPAGVSIGFTAVAILSDNTSRPVTGMVTWSSSDDTVVAISNAGGSRGTATALAAGSVTITATLAGVSGTTTYTVGAQTLSSIDITPAMPSVAKGGTLNLSATGRYSDGSSYDLSEFVTWISSMSGVATVSNAAGTRGLATGVAAGTTTVQAHFQGKTGSVSLTVTP